MYHHEIPFKCETNTVKCLKERKFRQNIVLMCTDAKRKWFVSVMTAGCLVCGRSEGHDPDHVPAL